MLQRQGSFLGGLGRQSSFRNFLGSPCRNENDSENIVKEGGSLRRSRSLMVSNNNINSTNRRSNQTERPTKRDEEEESKRMVELHRKIMETQIRALAEERNDYKNKCQTQATTISKMKKEQSLQSIKVDMLEQMVHTFSAITESALSSPTVESNQVKSTKKRATTKIQVLVNGDAAWYSGTLDDDDCPHGNGILKFSNGDKCVGDICDAEMHGIGTLYCAETMEVKRGRFVHDVHVE